MLVAFEAIEIEAEMVFALELSPQDARCQAQDGQASWKEWCSKLSSEAQRFSQKAVVKCGRAWASVGTCGRVKLACFLERGGFVTGLDSQGIINITIKVYN